MEIGPTRERQPGKPTSFPGSTRLPGKNHALLYASKACILKRFPYFNAGEYLEIPAITAALLKDWHKAYLSAECWMTADPLSIPWSSDYKRGSLVPPLVCNIGTDALVIMGNFFCTLAQQPIWRVNRIRFSIRISVHARWNPGRHLGLRTEKAWDEHFVSCRLAIQSEFSQQCFNAKSSPYQTSCFTPFCDCCEAIKRPRLFQR